MAFCEKAARLFGLVGLQQIGENWRMLRAEQFEMFQLWVYRIGGFMVLNVLDDPAWLALVFC